MFTEKNKIILIILIIGLLYGIQPIIFSKIIDYNIPKKKIMVYIAIINMLLILAYIYYFDKDKNIKEHNHTHDDKLNLCSLFLIYALCITIQNLLYTYNIDQNTVISHNALLNISPLFTLLIAYFILNKEITIIQGIGAGLIFFGSYIICK